MLSMPWSNKCLPKDAQRLNRHAPQKIPPRQQPTSPSSSMARSGFETLFSFTLTERRVFHHEDLSGGSIEDHIHRYPSIRAGQYRTVVLRCRAQILALHDLKPAAAKCKKKEPPWPDARTQHDCARCGKLGRLFISLYPSGCLSLFPLLLTPLYPPCF